MERKKNTLIWHFLFIVSIGVLIYLTILNVGFVTHCWVDCVEFRNKILIFGSSLALVIIVYVFYVRRVVPSVPKKKLASTRVRKAKMKDSEEKEVTEEGKKLP